MTEWIRTAAFLMLALAACTYAAVNIAEYRDMRHYWEECE